MERGARRTNRSCSASEGESCERHPKLESGSSGCALESVLCKPGLPGVLGTITYSWMDGIHHGELSELYIEIRKIYPSSKQMTDKFVFKTAHMDTPNLQAQS